MPANDFTIEEDAINSVTLSIRCQEWTITRDEDLEPSDIEMFERMEKVLNDNSEFILGDDDGEDGS